MVDLELQKYRNQPGVWKEAIGILQQHHQSSGNTAVSAQMQWFCFSILEV